MVNISGTTCSYISTTLANHKKPNNGKKSHAETSLKNANNIKSTAITVLIAQTLNELTTLTIMRGKTLIKKTLLSNGYITPVYTVTS